MICLLLSAFCDFRRKSNNGVWPVPVTGPLVGGVLGAFISDFFVGRPLARAGEAAAVGEQGMDPGYNLDQR